MHFERIEGKAILGARTYFTSFSHTVLARKDTDSQFEKNIERSLKILLLTKNVLISGASVITSSDFIYNFLKKNPILLEKDMIIPALRNDKKSVGEYVDRLKGKTDEEKAKIAQFYDKNIKKVVSWEEKETSDWFRSAFITGFKEKNSVILSNLKNVASKKIDEFIDVVQNDRQKIEEAISIFPKKEQHIIGNYRDLIYHISGARVVNCESNLPQENYIDYSLADIKERKTILSEVQIFWKVFLELFFETINKPKIPIEVLDLLSFQDIQKIREPLFEIGFIETYNKLINISIAAVKDNNPDKLILNIEELFRIREKLVFYFSEIFEKELSKIEKRKGISQNKKLKNNFNINLTFSSFPSLSGVIQNTTSHTSFLFNTSEGFNNSRAEFFYKEKLELKQNELINSSQRIDTSEKKHLLNSVKLLIASVNEKMIF